MPSTNNGDTYDYRNDPSLSATWKYRFDFFEKHGVSDLWKQSKEYTEAVKALSVGERFKVMFNFFAAFFSIIYLLVLGLWRKALVILAIAFVLGFIMGLLNLPPAAFRGVSIGIMIFTAMRTNTYLYLKKVKGIDDWKP